MQRSDANSLAAPRHRSYLVFVAVWGSGYIASKTGLQYVPPFTFLSLRFAAGLCVLLPARVLTAEREPLRWPVKRGRVAARRRRRTADACGQPGRQPLLAVPRHVRRRHRAGTWRRNRWSRQLSPPHSSTERLRRTMARRVHRWRESRSWSGTRSDSSRDPRRCALTRVLGIHIV